METMIQDIKKMVDSSVKGIKFIEPFETDSSHSIFYRIISNDDKSYICKIIEDTRLTGSYDCAFYEYEALLVANGLGIAPAPVFLNNEKRMLVVEHVDHVPFINYDIRSIKLRAKLGSQIAAAKFNPTRFRETHHDFVVDYEDNRNLIKEAYVVYGTPLHDSNLERLLGRAERYCSEFNDELEGLPKILSHNDLVAGNMLKRVDGKYVLIDFETVGISKPDFLIGQIAADAEIDWMAHKAAMIPLNQLFEILTKVTGFSMSYNVFYARVLERFCQNVAWGIRQVAKGRRVGFPQSYMQFRTNITDYCIHRIEELLEGKER